MSKWCLTKRRENFLELEKRLAVVDGFTLMPQPYNSSLQSSYYCAAVVLEKSKALKRFEIINYMKEKGVGTSIYYPQPVPRMTFYRKKYGYDGNQYANASRISDQMIALPIGPHLDTDQMKIVSDTFISALGC